MHKLCNTSALLGVGFLLLQVVAFFYAKLGPSRYFCWAPYDMHTRYAISVAIGDEALEPEAINARYGIPAHGFNPRSYAEVIDLVAQYETTYGEADAATVRIDYSVNGNPMQSWHHR